MANRLHRVRCIVIYAHAPHFVIEFLSDGVHLGTSIDQVIHRHMRIGKEAAKFQFHCRVRF